MLLKICAGNTFLKSFSSIGHEERAQSPDFHPSAFDQGVGHVAEKDIYYGL